MSTTTSSSITFERRDGRVTINEYRVVVAVAGRTAYGPWCYTKRDARTHIEDVRRLLNPRRLFAVYAYNQRNPEEHFITGDTTIRQAIRTARKISGETNYDARIYGEDDFYVATYRDGDRARND